MTSTRHKLSHLVDPGATLAAIDAMCAFRIDHTIVALVRLEDQVVESARVLHRGSTTPDAVFDDGREIVHDLACDMAPSMHREPPHVTHTFVTVVCRQGRVIDTARDWAWHWCWWYSNHNTCAYSGDIFVVTPHGWTGLFDSRAGHRPAARPTLAAVAASR